ncbi:MAG: protein-L-isoaspartate(D-aspartate) O-methyltransferase [Candidatus Omnitrophota bacterium]
MDYTALRKRMVEEQIVARGVNNKRVIDAFRKVERHRFIPVDKRASAYADFPISIGEGQTISQPYIVAVMTQSLDLSGAEKVLEIGTGSGYQTAILAELAKEVFTIERLQKLSSHAASTLAEMGYKNIHFLAGDGTLGWQEEAPFDRIIITAASPQIPLPLTEQLIESGKLVLPLGPQGSQMLTLVKKENHKLESTYICGCIFVPLIGKFGNTGSDARNN